MIVLDFIMKVWTTFVFILAVFLVYVAAVTAWRVAEHWWKYGHCRASDGRGEDLLSRWLEERFQDVLVIIGLMVIPVSWWIWTGRGL